MEDYQIDGDDDHNVEMDMDQSEEGSNGSDQIEQIDDDDRDRLDGSPLPRTPRGEGGGEGDCDDDNYNSYNRNHDSYDDTQNTPKTPPYPTITTSDSNYYNDNDERSTNNINNERTTRQNQQISNNNANNTYNHNDSNLKSSSSVTAPLPATLPQPPLKHIVQVLNVSPWASLEQIKTLFSFLGDINNIKLYQNYNDNDLVTNDYNLLSTKYDNIFKVCFIEFANSSSVKMAKHLTNTVFIDRALTILPYHDNNNCIPDQESAMAELQGSKLIYKFNIGLSSQIISTNMINGAQLISTTDPRLLSLGLPQYPNLPLCTDPNKVEEIRRTVYIGNLDSTMTPEQVSKFFNDIGETRFIRVAGDETQPTRFAFVEFNHQASVANALQHNGSLFGSRALKINHSNNAIVKPQIKQQHLYDYGSNQPPHLNSNNNQDHHHHHQSDLMLKRALHDREYGSRDEYHQSSRYPKHSSSNRYRSRDSPDDRRSRDRRLSPSRDSSSRRRRSKSRDDSGSRRQRSRSRDDRTRHTRRSSSRDRSGRSRRSRSRETSSRRNRRSRSRSGDRSKSSSRRHHKSSRR